MFNKIKSFFEKRTIPISIKKSKKTPEFLLSVEFKDKSTLQEELSEISFSGTYLTYLPVKGKEVSIDSLDIEGFIIKRINGEIIYTYGNVSFFYTKSGFPLFFPTEDKSNKLYPLVTTGRTLENGIYRRSFSFSGNTLILGKTGSGKSFLMQNILGKSSGYVYNEDQIFYFGLSSETPSEFISLSVSEFLTKKQNLLSDGKYFIHLDSTPSASIEDLIELKKELLRIIKRPCILILDEMYCEDNVINEMYRALVSDISKKTNKKICLSNTFILLQSLNDHIQERIQPSDFESIIVMDKENANSLPGEFALYLAV